MSFLVVLYWCFTSMGQTPSIHNLTIKDIDGLDIHLNSYQGIKLLIFIAPTKETEGITLQELDSIKNRYDTTIKLMGVMSYENGFVDSNKAAIKSMYASLGINLILTQGMHTPKATGSNQSDLFNWLTNKSVNSRFNIDAKGVGQKFFIDKTGKIYSVIPSEIPFTSTIVTNLITKKF